MSLLSFVNVDLILSMTGQDGLATWAVVASLLPWLSLGHLGLPLTVQAGMARQTVVEHEAAPDVLATGIKAMLLLVALLTPVAIVVGWMVHRWVLPMDTPASIWAVMAACWCMALSGLCMINAAALYAQHRGVWPNAYPAIMAIYICLALLAARTWGLQDFNILLVLLNLGPVLTWLHATWLVLPHVRFSPGWRDTFDLIRASRHNLYFAFLSAAVLSVDYLVMSLILDANNIVQYTLVSRIFLGLLTLQTVMTASHASPVAELIVGGEGRAARWRLRQLLWRGLLLIGLPGTALVIFMDPVVGYWTSGQVNHIPMALAWVWLAYVLTRVWCDTWGMAVLSTGRAQEVNRWIPLQVLLGLACQYGLGRVWGATGVALGIMMSYWAVSAWLNPRIALRLTRSVHFSTDAVNHPNAS